MTPPYRHPSLSPGCPVSDPALPPSLNADIRELRLRLDNLERSPRLISSSIEGGALRVLDSSGNEIFVAGEFTHSTTKLGMRIQATNGADLLLVTSEDGAGIPRRALPWRPVITQDFESTTSGTFVVAWESRMGVADADALRTSLLVTLNAADTAEVKCVMGADETDTVTLSGATQTQWTLDLEWDHGKTLGGGPHDFKIHVRRSAGTTAAVNVYRPHPLEQTNAFSIAATSGGLTAS